MPKKKHPPKLPKTRRPKGSGSSSPDARRGGWKGKVPVGKRPDGKTLYRYFHADTQRAVEDLMRTAQKPDPNTLTVGEWCDRWLLAMTQKPASKVTYRQQVAERIKPSLGAIKLAALTAWDIEEASAKWDVGANTARNTLGTLSGILQSALRARLITSNPARVARKPAKPAVKFDLFTRAELRLILDAGLARQDRSTFAVLVGTGCRIGEAIALKKDDFNASTGRLAIRRTWTPHGVGTPKSRRSLRTIRVDDELHATLAAGVPNCHYSSAIWRWKAMLKELGIRVRGVHQIRHSVASYSLAAGVPIPDLAKHLGDTPEEMVRTYCHETGVDVCGAIAGFLKP